MIIGISGHISSGKDTTAKIIQYLTLINKPVYKDVKYDLFIRDNNQCYRTYKHRQKWEIKHYADKLKQVCSILTGLPLELFYSEEGKNTVLGKEWNRFYAKGNRFISNTNPKGRITDYFNSKDEVLTYINSSYLNEFQGITYEIQEEQLTIRTLLQEVGIDVMRNIINPNVWVNALMSEYDSFDNIESYNCKTGLSNCLNYTIKQPHNIKHPNCHTCNEVVKTYKSNWLIPDVRFENDAKAITDRGGFIIRVNRDDYELVSIGEERIKLYNHESETALDNYPFHYIIDNNGTIEELIEKVKLILITKELL